MCENRITLLEPSLREGSDYPSAAIDEAASSMATGRAEHAVNFLKGDERVFTAEFGLNHEVHVRAALEFARLLRKTEFATERPLGIEVNDIPFDGDKILAYQTRYTVVALNGVRSIVEAAMSEKRPSLAGSGLDAAPDVVTLHLRYYADLNATSADQA